MQLFKYIMVFLYFISCAFNALSLNQLSFSGGGAFGAVELGILKKLRTTNKIKYDLYTGISAGGINAGYLSHFENLDDGIEIAEKFYNKIKNPMIYSFKPTITTSVFNTDPMKKTFTNILELVPYRLPLIETYIGTTNLYSGNLDIFRYDLLETVEESVDLLMCTSDIPILFPPIIFRGVQYSDGSILQNELMNIKHADSYLNITYITPFNGLLNDDKKITNLKEMILRTGKIIGKNFNKSTTKLNTKCTNTIGEINKYFVGSELLSKYNILNFECSDELIKIGYDNVQHEKLYLC